MIKKLFVPMMFVISFVLAACGEKPAPEPSATKLVSVPTAEQQYLANKAAVEKVAKDEVNKANLKDVSGCNIVPATLETSKAYHELKLTGAQVYKSACRSAVVAMKASEKQKAAMTASKARRELLAKQREQKLAAAKQVKPIASHPAERR